MYEFDTNSLDITNRLISSMQSAMIELQKGMEGLASNAVSSMKIDHRYQNRTGNLSASMEWQGNKSDCSVEVYLNNSKLIKAGYNYGVIQNDGMGSGYLRSKYSTVGGTKNVKQLKYDHFFDRSVEKNLIDKMPEIAIKVMKERLG